VRAAESSSALPPGAELVHVAAQLTPLFFSGLVPRAAPGHFTEDFMT